MNLHEISVLFLSLAVMGAGLALARSRLVARRRLGIGIAIAGVLVNPWSVGFASRSIWFHSLLVVVASLWCGVIVFFRELMSGRDRVEDRGRIAKAGLRWIWALVVLQDVLLWLGFQGSFEAASTRDPVLMSLLTLVEAAVGILVIYLLSGDGRPRVTHIRQVLIAWSSAMVIMGLGVSLGLSGPWFGFYAHSPAALHLQVEQQVAAALFVILGGAPWFLIGTRKMGHWLDAEEREGSSRLRAPGLKMGSSVKVRAPGYRSSGRR